MKRISVAIATYNEEANIVDCLKSAQLCAQEIVVVDGSSTDKTVALATPLASKIIVKDNKLMFHINKNIAIDNCGGDWILQLDADERVSKDLAEELTQVASGDTEYNGFYVRRKNLFLGRFMKKTGVYPDPVIRFFKKGKGKLPAKSVHEQIEIEGRVGWLKNDLIHFADPTFFRYLVRSNRYTTLAALELRQQDPGTSLFAMMKFIIFLPTARFLSLYIRHKGFADGFPGFVFSLYSALHLVTAYIKYWEAKNESGDRFKPLEQWA